VEFIIERRNINIEKWNFELRAERLTLKSGMMN
jgi:hypothetical protein